MKLFVVLLCAMALAQQPPEPPKPGVIAGRIVNGKTGEPVRNANVTLRPSGEAGRTGNIGPLAPAPPYAATTDAEGKFRIESVEPGSYRMSAERQGFVRQEYGARQNSMMGTTIKVAAGEKLTDLDFKMIPQAVITGRVLDEEGEPLARVQIQVLRRRYFRGKAQLVPSGGGQTIDTGEFRVSDLAPGRYWISATWRAVRMLGETPPRNTADKPEEEYVTTYYPGTTDQAGARALDVAAGDEVPGIDIRMQKARVYRIRGKVVGATRPLRLMVLPRDRNAVLGFFGGAGAMTKADGSFEIGSVQPGSYYIAAMSMQGTQSVVGKAPVDVARENVENVVITIGSGSTLTGSIRAGGDKKIAFSGIRVQLSPMEGMAFNVPNATAKEDGSFVLENVAPDRYRVMVFNLPQDTWLESVRAGDREVLDSGIDLSAGAAGNLQIVLGQGTGTITGAVKDAKQRPVSGSLVTLLPDPVKEERYDLYRTTTADQRGQFNLQSIPPGEYKLFAWEDVDPGSYMDPDFLKPLESKARKITVKPNSRQEVSLTQIPAEDTATPR